MTAGKTFFQRWFGPAAPSPSQKTTEAMAQSGVAEAQFSLGLRYANGEGIAQDYAQAEQWYLKAAGQNHALATFNLGMMHANGHGVPRDPVQSLKWIQKAADLGDAGAQYNLGLTHKRLYVDKLSENIPRSQIDAYKWLRLAADQGYKNAESACEAVNLDLTREEVIEGTKRIAAFNATKAEVVSSGQL